MASDTTATTRLTIRRTFKVPRQRLFDAWTQPQHLLQWWRCDSSWTTELADVDLRVCGTYRLSMQDPSKDHLHTCFGEFREVDPPSKLVYTWSWEPPDMQMDETIVTVEFLDQGEQTELILTHEGFPGSEATQEHDQGWQAVIESLAATLAD